MRLFFTLQLLLITFAFSACMDDDSYSLSASDALLSDVDTLRFDTIISGEPTNTYTFRLFNPSKDYQRVVQAYLEGGASSPFHVNIDGQVIGEGVSSSLEVAGHDSLSVFLMANLPDADSDVPQFVRDRLVIVTEGGGRTEVVLEASGQSVIKLNAARIASKTTFDAQRPYQIFDSLVVEKGQTLRLAAGTRLWLHSRAQIIVHGTLLVDGTLDKPVCMRGDRLGDMFNNQSYDRIPAQWGGIVIAPESAGNVINYADIHSGTFGISIQNSGDPTLSRLRLENSIVHNMSGLCLEAEGSTIFVGNSQLTNGGAGCVTLRGGNATFVHCTIGRFYAFQGGYGAALTLTNADEAGEPLAMERADFFNSIISGYTEDEVMAVRAYDDGMAAFNFYFDHCLLDTDPVDDATIANLCLWDNKKASVCREDNFAPAFDYTSLIFTFYLSPESQAIGTADAAISAAYYPSDREGRSRGMVTDMGCYQHDTSE